MFINSTTPQYIESASSLLRSGNIVIIQQYSLPQVSNSDKNLMKEKIKKWEENLPKIKLTLKQQKSIQKGALQAKQRKGEFI